jgi:predicted RNA methylase
LNADYTEARMKALGLTKTPWRESGARSLLSYKLAEDSTLGLLIRLFFFAEEVPIDLISSNFPRGITEIMVQSGMLQREGNRLFAACMLTHFENLLLACDSVRRVRTDVPSDLVLGVNTPTHILARCMLRLVDASEVLDLGTGCGTLALHAAAAARHVFGTDINPRALEFMLFNAALNAIPNAEALAGDRFEVVKGRRFDLILCNPPFFLAPKSKLAFTDSPFPLDTFVESVARQAPAFLKEGGYCQMLCEWVELKGQPWRQRLQSWFEESGCDVLVLKAYEITPPDYVLKRAAEAASLRGELTREDLLGRARYFEEHGVEKILGGLVTMRRSMVRPDGKPRLRNWFVFDEMEEIPSAPIGDLLVERFSAETVITSNSDSCLLSAKPRLSKDVILVEEAVQQGKSWKPRIIYLERRSGLPRRLGFEPQIAQLLASWDGSRELGFLIGEFAKQHHLSKDQITPDWLRLARRLACLSLITFQ